MKRLNYLLLAILLLSVGLITVDAKTYTSYKKGDKITVNVNDSTKLDFYVIEDSSTEAVTAIYDGVLGDDFYFGPTTNSIAGSTAESKLKELTSTWKNPTEIRLVKASEIISGIKVSTDTSEDFTEPSYFNMGKSYWTQDVTVNGDKYYPLVVTSWITYSQLHSAIEGAPSSTGAIRPVITVLKDNVVDGISEEADPTDINSFKIDVEAQTATAGANLTMKVVGTLNDDSEYSYYVKFVNKGDVKPTDYPENVFGDIDVDADDITKWKRIYKTDDTNYSNQISIGYDWYMLNGYDYAYFLMCNNDTCTISDEPLKVDRPSLPELTQRYHVFAFTDELNTLDVFPYFPYLSGKNGSHKLSVKIGRIDDEKLLSSVLKQEKGAFENLMKYAIDNDGTLYSEIDSDFRDISLKDFKVQNGAYYYIYTTYENSDGMYRDLSDISIAIGENDMLVNDIEWNPNTGDINIAVIIAGAVLLVGVAVVAYRKTRVN